jgi:hypothetical protein
MKKLTGVTVVAAFFAGAAAGHFFASEPTTFAECLLVNVRDARAADAIPAIAQACESLHPDTAKTFGADLAMGEERRHGGR